ncbi:Branched-chain amino acid transport system / permease component [Gaiella occulta]|uniref:Branched-chain amino acid transport system / permease component n=1 Tax=Gaiella occulta TaxID=1002870 RepID=A0A7M2YY13_9ACTN|nr:ATP-binding cassette domain-containing protein [Gaiella occulta]RDI74368.1 Branched-chain amino acid transport system / permease component [Gaiella occulta]
MLVARRLALPALLVASVLAVAGSSFLLPSYWLFLATSAVIGAIVARSTGLVTGQAGMISLCQLSFAAVGAWVVSRLSLTGQGVPFLVQIVAAGLAAVPLGILVGLPALRLRGVHLAVVTLGFATTVDVYLRVKGFPREGFASAVSPPGPFDDPRIYFELCFGTFVVVALLLALAGRRRVGAAWLAVRHSERATAAMGMSVPRVKLTAFATSAFVAGLSGGLLTGQVGLVTPENFAPVGSLVTFAVAVMTAAQYVEGAILAGVLVAFFPEVLRRLGLPLDIADLAFALGAIDVLRRGRGGIAAQARQAMRRRGGRRSPAHTSVATAPPARPPRRTRSADAGATPALEVKGLTVRFGEVAALDGVDLRVRPGTVHALIGPNGAGKTTLVDAVTGFLPRYGGDVLVAGFSLDGLLAYRRARAGVRRTFQQDRTIPDLSVGDYVRLAAGHRTSARDAEAVLGFLGCPAADRPVGSLDVGTRRLVEVAGALAARPALLLLDEPAAGMTEVESADLAQRIAAIPSRFDCAVLLIEHDMAHVVAASSEVTVVDFGRTIASGSPRDVLEHPDVVAAYLGQEIAV